MKYDYILKDEANGILATSQNRNGIRDAKKFFKQLGKEDVKAFQIAKIQVIKEIR